MRGHLRHQEDGTGPSKTGPSKTGPFAGTGPAGEGPDRGRRDRGAVVVVVAISMSLLLAAAALAFDIGSQVDTNRSTQSLADAIALDAANFVTGQEPGSPDDAVTVPSGQQTQAAVIQYEAGRSAIRNGVSSADLAGYSVYLCDLGSGSASCTGDAYLERCPLDGTTCTPNPQNPYATTAGVNAVAADASGSATFVFEPGATGPNRAALAGDVGWSQFSVAPTLLTVSSATVGSICSSLLSLLPASTCDADLTALSTNSVLGATVTIGQLAATGLGGGTTEGLIALGDVSDDSLLGAIYQALTAQDTPLGTAAAALLASDLDVSATGSPDVAADASTNFGQLLCLNGNSGCQGSSVSSPGSSTAFTLGSLLAGMAEIGTGTSFLTTSLSGLGAVEVSGNVVAPAAVSRLGPGCQPADSTDCPTTATASNAEITVTTPPGGGDATLLAGLLGSVTVSLVVSLQITLADASGTLQSVSCGSTPTALISGTAGAATITGTISVDDGSSVRQIASLSASLGNSAWRQSPVTLGQNQSEQVDSGAPLDVSLSYSSGDSLSGAIAGGLNGLLSLLGLGSLGTVPNSLAGDLSQLTSDPASVLADLGVTIASATVSDDQITCAPQLLG